MLRRGETEVELNSNERYDAARNEDRPSSIAVRRDRLIIGGSIDSNHANRDSALRGIVSGKQIPPGSFLSVGQRLALGVSPETTDLAERSLTGKMGRVRR